MSIGPYILLLPDIALERIFSFLTYDEIAKNRLVCKKFNNVGSNLLSRGFIQIEKKHAAILKRVKSMLPRRESERRVHPLFRHCDILSAVETRINMLNMTYMKYIQNNLCCFIPGKVLDELERVLGVVEKGGTPPKTHEILQELRDISSMAMEYFDEKILPSIKEQNSTSIISYGSSSSSLSGSRIPKVYFIQPGLQEEIHKLNKNNKKQKDQINVLTKELQKIYEKIHKKSNIIKSQSTLLQEHETKLQEQATKLQEQETALNNLKKIVDEWDQKFSDFAMEIIRSRETMSKTILPPIPNLKPKLTNKTFTRPRLSQVQAPNTYLMELERKRKSSMEYDIPQKIRFITKKESFSALQLKEQINNKIHENITQNISKNITMDNQDSNKKGEFSNFISSSLEAILKNPISSIKSRKRRSTDDLELNNLD